MTNDSVERSEEQEEIDPTEILLDELIDEAVQASHRKEKELWNRYHELRGKNHSRRGNE